MVEALLISWHASCECSHRTLGRRHGDEDERLKEDRGASGSHLELSSLGFDVCLSHGQQCCWVNVGTGNVETANIFI